MQTINYYCDLCNAKIIYGRKRLLLIVDIDDDGGEEDIMEQIIHSDSYDLCPSCAKALKDWIDNRGMEVVDEKSEESMSDYIERTTESRGDNPGHDGVPGPPGEVVFCKDCDYIEYSDCYGECGRGYLGIVKPYDYCSRGMRRDKEADT